MRGGVLLAVGAVSMIAALCFVAVVAVYAARQAQEPAYVPPAVPAEPPTPEQVEELERKENVPMPEREKAVVVQEPPKNAPQESVAAPTAQPAADTNATVAVSTCEGGAFRLNLAEKRMLDLHNRTRNEHQLDPLCVSPDLTQVARSHSQDMLKRDYFSHYTPEGTTVTEHMERIGYPVSTRYATGENIAMGGDVGGAGSPGHLFVELMHSPGHRANILDEEFRQVGVGALRGTYSGSGYDPADPATVYTVDFGAWVN